MQGAPRKKQYQCFFRGAPEISRKINFHICTLGQLWQIKIDDSQNRKQRIYFVSDKPLFLLLYHYSCILYRIIQKVFGDCTHIGSKLKKLIQRIQIL